jgi:hypothetical protein
MKAHSREVSAGFAVAVLLISALLAIFSDAGVAAPGAPAHRPSVTSQLDCSACHTSDSWKITSAVSGDAAFDHSRTGFPLTQRHRAVSCGQCHRADRQVTRQCVGCHQDPHQGRLGASCDGCHSAASWLQPGVFERHRQTRLPLTGMHALTECRDCHQRTSERTWTTSPAECFSCHAADYRRVDIHPPHVGVAGDPDSPPFPRDCSQCHRATGWVPAFVEAATIGDGFASLGSGRFALQSYRSHDRVFPLSSGPHRGAPCGSCHTSRAAPRAVRCNGCHAHSDIALKAQHREVLGFGAACLVCHPGGSAR